MRIQISLLLIISVFLVACSREPEPINYGQDACEHCKMTIMDQKFGAEIVTRKGKILKFDAAECMVEYINSYPQNIDLAGDRFLTTDYAKPGTLIQAENSFFLKDKAYQSPMGGNLASFSSRQLAENNLQSADGKILNWQELIEPAH